VKTLPFLAILMAATGGSACHRSPRLGPSTPPPEEMNGHPVVHVAPVLTRPFESGYDAGFEYGKSTAVPRAPIPEGEEALRVARQQTEGRPERTDRWARGFAEGYADGVRNVVTGQK
jgi:hypothetical protein